MMSTINGGHYQTISTTVSARTPDAYILVSLLDPRPKTCLGCLSGGIASNCGTLSAERIRILYWRRLGRGAASTTAEVKRDMRIPV